MDPMFLPQIEAEPAADSPYGRAIAAARRAGAEYPQIWHLFAFRPAAGEHLARFTQEVMREPAPLTAGLRELIAAYTSRRNHCPF